jgi:hypothetical protein
VTAPSSGGHPATLEWVTSRQIHLAADVEVYVEIVYRADGQWAVKSRAFGYPRVRIPKRVLDAAKEALEMMSRAQD